MRSLPCPAIGSISRRLLWRFAGTRQASVGVEFGLCGIAFFGFLLAIVNLGDLGFILGMLEYGGQVTARQAAVQTTSGLNANNPTACLPNSSTIQTDFNNTILSLLPAATGSTTDGSPVITAIWVDNVLGNIANQPQTLFLNLNVRYQWKPIGFSNWFPSGITLGITTIATVLGPAGLPASC